MQTGVVEQVAQFAVVQASHLFVEAFLKYPAAQAKLAPQVSSAVTSLLATVADRAVVPPAYIHPVLILKHVVDAPKAYPDLHSV